MWVVVGCVQAESAAEEAQGFHVGVAMKAAYKLTIAEGQTVHTALLALTRSLGWDDFDEVKILALVNYLSEQGWFDKDDIVRQAFDWPKELVDEPLGL